MKISGQIMDVFARGNSRTAVIKLSEPIADLNFKEGDELRVSGALPFKKGITIDADAGIQGTNIICSDFSVRESKEETISNLRSIKGIGKERALAVYDKHPKKTLEIVHNTPKALSDVSGLNGKTLVGAVQSYDTRRIQFEIYHAYKKYGITSRLAEKIIKAHKGKSLTILKEYPYELTKIRGINFLIVDDIASDCGFSKTSMERIVAGVHFKVRGCTFNGDMYIEEDVLIRDTKELLGISNTKIIKRAIKDLLVKKEISLVRLDKKRVYYDNYNYLIESQTAEEMKRIAEGGESKDLDLDGLMSVMDIALENSNTKFDPIQIEAIKTSLSSGLSVITGGPGTGKTTIINMINRIYKEHTGRKTLLCSPTGKAARRMSEATGELAVTIHSALNITPAEDDAVELVASQNFGDYGLIIVDEASMLESYLAKTLFEQTMSGSKLVLVGDVDQLPSVGPGFVLSEIIDSEYVNTTKLRTVFRQNDGSLIALNAARIKSGNSNLEFGNGFEFIRDTGHNAIKKAIDLFVSNCEKYGTDNVLFLTPFRKKESGSQIINEMIRQRINPPYKHKKEVSFGQHVFREGDKVIQMANKKMLNKMTMEEEFVSNGDTGYITEVFDADHFEVKFAEDRIVDYKRKDFPDLSLGYALTVHKSQGSEAKVVIMLMLDEHKPMFLRNLLYTGITRGKNTVKIVGSSSAIKNSIRKEMKREGRRKTLLGAMIFKKENCIKKS